MKISKDVAEAEFERMLEANAILLDLPGSTKEDQDSAAQVKGRILHAMMLGSLVIDEAGQPVFTPQRGGKEGSSITFYEPTGASFMAMDLGKSGHEVSKMFHALANITRTNAKLFSSMKAADLKVCTALATIFLA